MTTPVSLLATLGAVAAVAYQARALLNPQFEVQRANARAERAAAKIARQKAKGMLAPKPATSHEGAAKLSQRARNEIQKHTIREAEKFAAVAAANAALDDDDAATLPEFDGVGGASVLSPANRLLRKAETVVR
jgi:hypothetical protein